MQRYYTLDIRDYFRPDSGLTARRLIALISNLPAESAFGQRLAGVDAGWSMQNQLLAALHDRLTQANWQRSGGQGPQPRPLSRPGTRPDALGKTNRSPQEVAQYLAKFAPGGDE